MPYILEAACLCNTGKVRKNNEDNFFFDGRCLPPENDGLKQPITMESPAGSGLCVAVFDGMGGENFGEVASFAAAKCMQQMQSTKERHVSVREYLNGMCLKINEAVIAKQRELLTERMGSTMVALYFSKKQVHACNLGDSRAYRLRGGTFLQLSEDHVEKREGKKKNPLTQHLGISPDDFLIEPYIARGELRQGDQYLLCSDGLTDMLTNPEIEEIMTNAPSAEECAQRLVSAAVDKGGRDNVTVIVCRISGADEETPVDETTAFTAAGWTETPKPKAGKQRMLAFLIAAAAIIMLVILGFFTIHSWRAATCTEPEICKICGKTRGDPLGHMWEDWTTVKEASCTEEGLRRRICANDPAHIETEPIPASGHTWKDATCTEPSTCTICGKESDGPIGHDWSDPVYSWSPDNSSVTAKRVCRHDANHVEEETAETDGVIAAAATCTTNGQTTYTAVFRNEAFATQTRTVENIPAKGHEWGTVSYTWSPDDSSVTAKRVCRHDASHVEEETVNTNAEVSAPATCTTNGQTTYTAVFTNSVFEAQAKTVDNIAATGHAWGEASYSWSEDNRTVTAKRICENDPNHVEEETVRTVGVITTMASCTTKGKTTYSAKFSNDAFSVQTKTLEDIPATGHIWDEIMPEHRKQCVICKQFAPSEYDIIHAKGKIIRPASESYLEIAEEKTVRSELGHSIYVYWSPDGRPEHMIKDQYLYENETVQVLARQGNMSCVLFQDQYGDVWARWVYSDYLE